MRLALVVADFFVTLRDVEGWGLGFSSEDEESQSLQLVWVLLEVVSLRRSRVYLAECSLTFTLACDACGLRALFRPLDGKLG